MDLSILIPMYNAEKYIENCLNSLLAQGLEDFETEVLIVDDGSTDTSYKIASSFKNRIQNLEIISSDNQGPYVQRNRLLNLAKGEYIYFLDADDYMAEESLGNILKLVILNDLDVLGFETQSTTQFNLNKPNRYVEVSDDIVPCSGRSYVSEESLVRLEIWWYIIKKDYLDSLNLIFEENEFNADVSFTLTLLLNANRFYKIQNRVHRYVQTQNSITRNRNPYHRKKQVENLTAMIQSLSSLIETVKSNSFDCNENNEVLKVIENLQFRRARFTFLTLLKMRGLGYTKRQVKQKLNLLESIGAYPFSRNIGRGYSTPKFIVLKYIVNNKVLFPKFLGLYQSLKTNSLPLGEGDLTGKRYKKKELALSN